MRGRYPVTHRQQVLFNAPRDLHAGQQAGWPDPLEPDFAAFVEDREPALVRWFTRHIRGLPAPMTDELHLWFDVLFRGRTRLPRSHPRTSTTIRLYISWVLPTVRRWAEQGHESLREISREDVLAALSGSGTPRSTLGQGLRSLFGILKRYKLVFLNPLARIRTGEHERRQHLPLNDLAELRAALHSTDPARAAITALVAFHGLATGVLRELHLTDHRDGRLYLLGRVVLVAVPAQDRLARWLDYRGRRWPATRHPHLFINRATGVRLEAVGRGYIPRVMGIAPSTVRQDRILHEALACGGDPRRL